MRILKQGCHKKKRKGQGNEGTGYGGCGASAAARPRRLDEAAEIVMFERGSTFRLQTAVFRTIGGEIANKEDPPRKLPESFSTRFNGCPNNERGHMIDRAAKTVTSERPILEKYTRKVMTV